MRTDLDHLPERKQRELARVVEILHEEFEDKQKTATSAKRKRGRILKIILFGSHARGDWVEDAKGGYFSDYDLLIVVNDDKLTDMATYWHGAEDRLLRDPKIKTTPQFIVHTMDDVNAKLTEGQYFFSDIIRDGVMLYELTERAPNGKAKYKLAAPVPPEPKRALELAQGYFDNWRQKTIDSQEMYEAAIDRKKLNEAAFNLHQAAERAYTLFFLTRSLYMPKEHNVSKLRSRAEDMDPRLRAAWPRGQKPYDRFFELLRRAYVEARYSEHYETTPEALAWQDECITKLLGLIETACEEHLAELEKKANG
ncbi:MAG: HEPN domain-containing protein [Pseudomonadota bacterium]